MLLGLRTAIYLVKDLHRAKSWYTRLTGEAPYFDQPFYVGFNVGGYELGLLPDSKDEALAVFDFLEREEAEDRAETPSILRNLISGGWA